jgi:hypothetical protein
MRRRIYTVLVGALLLIPTGYDVTAAVADPVPVVTTIRDQAGGPNVRWDRDKYCRYQSLERGNWTNREVRLTIECAVMHWPTSLATALYVANRESNFRHTARNTSSGACGIYQHIPRYWYGRVFNFVDHHPRWRVKASCFNARTNILVSINMAHHHGWGPWSM